MFNRAKATWKAAEATALVARIVRAAMQEPVLDPDALAKTLVSYVCDARPDIFGFGRRKAPRPIVTAIAALAAGLTPASGFPLDARIVMSSALGLLLLDADRNRYRYDFYEADAELVAMARLDYIRFNQDEAQGEPLAHRRVEATPSKPEPTLEERLARLSADLADYDRRAVGRS